MEIIYGSFLLFFCTWGWPVHCSRDTERSAASSCFGNNSVTRILFVRSAVTCVLPVSLKLASNSSSLSVTGSTVVDSAACWVMRESAGRHQMLSPLDSAPGGVNSRISADPYSLHISPQLH